MPNDINLFLGIGYLVIGICMLYIGVHDEMW